MTQNSEHLNARQSVDGSSLTRREILTTAAAAVGGRIKQSICKGCLGKLKLTRDQEAAMAAKLGLSGLDLVGRKDWDAVKKHGLVATMVPGAGRIKDGLNNKSRHPEFLKAFRDNIKAAAEYKWPNVICMAGDRKGISDEQGMDNCQLILTEAVKIAEDGASNCAAASVRRVSNCSTTSTTCRSWRAT
jgi:hydroxypyruvate isomerase